MSRLANGVAGHEPIDLDRRIMSLETRSDAQADYLDQLRIDVAVIRAKLEASEKADESRHDELVRLFNAQTEGHKCIRSVAERLTEPRVLLVLSVTALVSALAGTGLAVKLADWLSIAPAGVP